jgi:glycosyltransferase involved in cell wall biosynthesis
VNRAARVVVVLANWNGARFLNEAIQSVVAQTFMDWRLVSVDTGSTDDSREILESWAKIDPRVELLFSPTRLNYPAAINLGIRAATSEFVGRIESDDVWHPQKLEKQLNFFDLSGSVNVGVCGGDAMLIDSAGVPYDVKRFPRNHESCLKAIWFRNPFCHSGALVRRMALEQCGPYDERLYLVEDLDLWFRIARNWRLHNLSEPLVSYRVWPGSLTNRRLRTVAWRSYQLRTNGVRAYGYHCPRIAQVYGLATLLAVLLPASLVIRLFGLGLRIAGRNEKQTEQNKCKSAHEPLPLRTFYKNG